MNLKPGDSVYYEPHSALGYLVERYVEDGGQPIWRYALRSAPRDDPNKILVSMREESESSFLEAISSGRLAYYAVGSTE